MGNLQLLAVRKGDLATGLQAQGKYEESIEMFSQAMQHFRDFGDKRNEAAMLGNMAGQYMLLEKAEKAIPLLSQAVDMVQDIGDRRIESIHLKIWATRCFKSEICLLLVGYAVPLLWAWRPLVQRQEYFLAPLALLLAQREASPKRIRYWKVVNLLWWTSPQSMPILGARKGKFLFMQGDREGAEHLNKWKNWWLLCRWMRTVSPVEWSRVFEDYCKLEMEGMLAYPRGNSGVGARVGRFYELSSWSVCFAVVVWFGLFGNR